MYYVVLSHELQVRPGLPDMGGGTFFKVGGGHNSHQKNYIALLWFELATVTSQSLKYGVITCIPYEGQNYIILDKITPLGKRMGEPLHIWIGCYRGDTGQQCHSGSSYSLFWCWLNKIVQGLSHWNCHYIGEVLLNHLIFADDICVFCPSVRWLQRLLDVCQAYAGSHGIIFNCNKTVCVTFKPKSAKSTATPLLKLEGQ